MYRSADRHICIMRSICMHIYVYTCMYVYTHTQIASMGLFVCFSTLAACGSSQAEIEPRLS